MATIDQVYTELTDIRKELKNVMKFIRKINTRVQDPDGEKAKARSANNGFNRPLRVCAELREFLGLADDELISRSEVTRRVNEYVTVNNLKQEDNKRNIILDDKLRALLNPPADVQLTFMNIQRYLSPHYLKDDAPATAACTPTPAATEDADLNGDGRVTRSEAAEHEAAKKKKPTVTKKKPTVRKPTSITA
jgi:chromatin remodeling complex protein RSC6